MNEATVQTPIRPATASPGAINARLDRLPVTRSTWLLVILLSLGGWFEFYDLFFTAYVGPGLVRSGVLTETTQAFLGFSGLDAFVAATFAGLFIGTSCLGWVPDRFGRRSIFTASLLWYTAATIVMACQTGAFGLNLWRLVAGIGIGMEFVTIDSYLAELVPQPVRGRAFVINQSVQYSAVPVVALLAYFLVPVAPLGLEGWRWVVLIGAVGALTVWYIRRALPESPRWLAQRGRFAEADAIVAAMETRIAAECGQPLPPPLAAVEPQTVEQGRFAELWRPPYRSRTIMLSVFNVFQTIGYYGFASWVPTLLIARGIEITHSLFYSFLIAIANPLGPLLAWPIADKVERKWVIVWAGIGIAVFGLLFAASTQAMPLVVFGLGITFSSNLLSFGFHSYQPELFPTRVRARAIGFVYSMSRLGAMASGFMVAYCLRSFGSTGVFALIVGSMVVVVASVGVFGPRTRLEQL
ncbi:MAG: MFS transporter [Janthinobacterium lividum]